MCSVSAMQSVFDPETCLSQLLVNDYRCDSVDSTMSLLGRFYCILLLYHSLYLDCFVLLYYPTLWPRLLSYIQQSSCSVVQLQACHNEVELSCNLYACLLSTQLIAQWDAVNGWCSMAFLNVCEDTADMHFPLYTCRYSRPRGSVSLIVYCIMSIIIRAQQLLLQFVH